MNAMQPFFPSPPSLMLDRLSAYASVMAFMCSLLEAVVSFILDYKQLLIIFICAAKFILVVIFAPLWPTAAAAAANACPSGLLFLLFFLLSTLCCSAIVVASCIVCLLVSAVCMYVCMFVWLCAWIWRQSRRHFQDILLAFVVPFIAFAFSFAAHLCCWCLSRILTWSILAICWSTNISVRAEMKTKKKENKIHSWYIKSAANLWPDFHIFPAHNARGYYNLV